MKRKAKKLKVPTNVQKTIPYEAVYEHNGIIEIEPGVFTKSYLLHDVNYQIAKQSEQDEMFLKYGEFLNSFEPAHRFQITINQRNIDMARFEEETMLPLKGDNLDYLREERNRIMKDKIREGRNNMVKEKYLTVACKADSLEGAQSIFARLDTEMTANIAKIGNAQLQPLSTPQRLEILHDIYNIGSEGFFGNNVELDAEGNPVFCKEKFVFDTLIRCKELIVDIEVLRKALKKWYAFRKMPDNSKQVISYYRKNRSYGIPSDVLKTIKVLHNSTG